MITSTCMFVSQHSCRQFMFIYHGFRLDCLKYLTFVYWKLSWMTSDKSFSSFLEYLFVFPLSLFFVLFSHSARREKCGQLRTDWLSKLGWAGPAWKPVSEDICWSPHKQFSETEIFDPYTLNTERWMKLCSVFLSLVCPRMLKMSII